MATNTFPEALFDRQLVWIALGLMLIGLVDGDICIVSDQFTVNGSTVPLYVSSRIVPFTRNRLPHRSFCKYLPSAGLNIALYYWPSHSCWWWY